MTKITKMMPALLAASLLSLSTGCAEKPGGGAGATGRETRELLLYCGAGIRPAAEKLIAAFEEKTGIRVNATYAGSGRLLGQLTAARTGDLYMPGAAFYVDTAIEKGLADRATKRVAMYFVPVVFVRKGNPKGVHSLRDLTREGLRVGFGDQQTFPSVGDRLPVTRRVGGHDRQARAHGFQQGSRDLRSRRGRNEQVGGGKQLVNFIESTQREHPTGEVQRPDLMCQGLVLGPMAGQP